MHAAACMPLPHPRAASLCLRCVSSQAGLRAQEAYCSTCSKHACKDAAGQQVPACQLARLQLEGCWLLRHHVWLLHVICVPQTRRAGSTS